MAVRAKDVVRFAWFLWEINLQLVRHFYLVQCFFFLHKSLPNAAAALVCCFCRFFWEFQREMFLDFQFELRLWREPGLTGQAIFYILTLLWFVFMWLHGMTEDGRTGEWWICGYSRQHLLQLPLLWQPFLIYTKNLLIISYTPTPNAAWHSTC